MKAKKRAWGATRAKLRRICEISRWSALFCKLLFFKYVCQRKTDNAMTPVKLKVYISHTPDDKKTVKELYDFLRPMHDEVDIWYNDPPPAPRPLSLPWEWISLLLPIFQPRDFRGEYAKVNQRRKERAHIYLFMTSYKSLNDPQIQNDLRLAAGRRVDGDWLSPHIFPVILAPSLWKEKSPLSNYDILGPKKKTLVEVKPIEEGFYEIAKQLSKVIKEAQRGLDEAKFAQSRLAAPDGTALPASQQAQPYLGDEDDSLEYRPPSQVNPPEWLGWMIWFFLFISLMRGLRGDLPRATVGRQDAERPVPTLETEYPREQPMRPVLEDKPLPPPD